VDGVRSFIRRARLGYRLTKKLLDHARVYVRPRKKKTRPISNDSETIKIYVITAWGTSGKKEHDFMRRFTPNCSGKWKNIETCDNFDDANLYIAFWCGDPVLRKRCPPHSVLNFMREPSRAVPKDSKLGDETIGSRWVTENHNPIVWQVGRTRGRATYSELVDNPFPSKSKLVSGITTGLYKLSGHKHRIEFLKEFTHAHPGILDLFGKNVGRFDLSTISDYKGPIKDKWDGLAPYRYSFVFENTAEKNYFSEKFADAILVGCMPIYWGCTNLSDFFPEDSFVELDTTKEEAVDTAMKIVNSNYREEHLSALKKAKELILNKYQIWPTLHQVINELRVNGQI